MANLGFSLPLKIKQLSREEVILFEPKRTSIKNTIVLSFFFLNHNIRKRSYKNVNFS